MAVLSKKAEHAIEFAEFCSGWDYVSDDDFETGYCWRNAPIGFEPFSGDLLKLTTEELYKLFLKHLEQ